MSVPTLVALVAALVVGVLFFWLYRKFSEPDSGASVVFAACMVWLLFVVIYAKALESTATVAETGTEVTVNIEIVDGEYRTVKDGYSYFFVKDDAGVIHETNYEASKVVIYTGSIVERPQLVVKGLEKVYEVPFFGEAREEHRPRVVVGIP